MSFKGKALCLIIILHALLLPTVAQAALGIVVALSADLKVIREAMVGERISVRGGREFISGRIGAVPVMVVRSPRGKIQNAMTTQMLLQHFPVDRVISLGSAGALDGSLEPGDILIAQSALEHDTGTIKPYGLIWQGEAEERSSTKDASPARRRLITLAKEAASRLSERNGGFQVAEGALVSGDQFIASEEKKEWLAKRFGARAVDMAGAAVARACQAHGVPFILIRLITDGADDQAGEEYGGSLRRFEGRLALIAKELVRGMPSPPFAGGGAP